jgi:hypothetical protein
VIETIHENVTGNTSQVGTRRHFFHSSAPADFNQLERTVETHNSLKQSKPLDATSDGGSHWPTTGLFFFRLFWFQQWRTGSGALPPRRPRRSQRQLCNRKQTAKKSNSGRISVTQSSSPAGASLTNFFFKFNYIFWTRAGLAKSN